jgi:hypothetical protein
MSLNFYEIGNAITLSVTFNDAITLLPADPTVTRLRIMDPTEFETNVLQVSLLHPSTGVFQYILTPIVPGIWKYRFSGTGSVIAADERRFEVIPSSFDTPF